ncbi:MAG: hypothetical protein ACI30V_07665 [Muribaculaceae bacterium]
MFKFLRKSFSFIAFVAFMLMILACASSGEAVKKESGGDNPNSAGATAAMTPDSVPEVDSYFALQQ